MTYTFKLARRLSLNNFSLMIAPLLLLSACTSGEPTEASTIELARGGIKGSPFVDLTITPSATTLKPSEKRTFVANGVRGKGDTVVVSVTWTATGGQISPAGEYSAGPIPGNYQVVGTQNDGGLADTSAVTISTTTQIPTLSGVILTPASASLAPGATQQFTAAGEYSDSTTAPIDVTYTATGGTVTSDGLYTVGQTPGTYLVIAMDTASRLADTASVTISSPVTSVTVTPSSGSVAEGRTIQLTAVATANGNTLSGQTFTWASSNPSVATVSSSGLVTGVAQGSARITATSGEAQGQSSITVTAGSVTTTQGCPDAGYLRLVNVASASELATALTNALAGDQIRLAPGNYTFTSGFTLSRNGTATSPITLCGPRTAVVYPGVYLQMMGSYWVVRGFRLTQGLMGVIQNGGGNNTYDSLEIDHTKQEGIHIKNNGSTGNVVRYNYIHDTGLTYPQFGEGIYIGNGSDPSVRVTNTWIHHNTVQKTTAEGIEIKTGSDGQLVEFNTVTNAGYANIVGDRGPIMIRSNNNRVNDNTVNQSTNVAIATGTGGGAGVGGYNNTFHRNVGSNLGANKVFQFDAGLSGNVVYCDNVAVSPAALGVTCTR